MVGWLQYPIKNSVPPKNLNWSHLDVATNLISADSVLDKFLEPERNRQRTKMKQAIERVCALILGRKG